nr:hypothetical protein [uncultured Buchnera sp.]
MENILNKYDNYIINSQYESYIPQITTELNKPNRNTIVIVDGKDKFLNIKNSKLYLSFEYIQEDGTKYPAKSNVMISDNAGAFLFQKIAIKLNNKIIDESENTGRVSTVKGYMSYAVDGNGPTQNSGFQSTSEGGGSVELIIPLSHFGLGSMKDIKSPLYNARFEIIFTRNTDDDALILETNTEATADTKNIKAKRGKINILELKVQMQTIEYDEITKIQIVDELIKNPCILAFKKWQCIEVRNLTGKKIRFDLTNNYRNNEHPLFGVVFFQKNRLDNQDSNAAFFDDCDVVNYSFKVNGKKYPNELQNQDFNDIKCCQSYEDHMSYKKTYYKSHEENPLMYLDKLQFRKNRPFFVVNMTRHLNQIAISNSTVILNVDFSQNLPDKTICYICLISRSVYTFDIERGIVDESF